MWADKKVCEMFIGRKADNVEVNRWFEIKI